MSPHSVGGASLRTIEPVEGESDKPHRRSVVIGLSSRQSWPAHSTIFEQEAAIAVAESAPIVPILAKQSRLFGAEERLSRNAVRVTNAGWLAGRLREPTAIEGRYDLAVTVVMSFRDLWPLAGLDLRAMAAHRLCFIAEIWPEDVRHFAMYKRVLDQFDHVFTSCGATVPVLRAELDVPVDWMPSGTETVLHLPAEDQERGLDVMSIGRRCPVQHRDLYEAARRRHLSYTFDSLTGLSLDNWAEHRFNLAEQTKRARLYVAHRAKFDHPEETGSASEFGNRFFDSYAAGAIPIGDAPNTERFHETFPRAGSYIVERAGRAGIAEHVVELCSKPDELRAISQLNVADALRRHDWIHRWQAMLAAVGLELGPAGEARLAVLEELARRVEQDEPYDALRDETLGLAGA